MSDHLVTAGSVNNFGSTEMGEHFETVSDVSNLNIVWQTKQSLVTYMLSDDDPGHDLDWWPLINSRYNEHSKA